jgi:hypothetical protein
MGRMGRQPLRRHPSRYAVIPVDALCWPESFERWP